MDYIDLKVVGSNHWVMTYGEWVHGSESGACPDCYRAELVREYLVDMEFIVV